MDELSYAKLGFSIVLYIECIALGLAPQRWVRCRKSERFLSLWNAFCGGMLLAVACVNLIPISGKLFYTYRFNQ